MPMIYQHEAESLLKQYGRVIEALQTRIATWPADKQRCLRSDDQVIAIIVAALKAIAADSLFFNPEPIIRNSGMSNIKHISPNASVAIAFVVGLLSTQFVSREKYWLRLMDCYVKGSDLSIQELTAFYKEITVLSSERPSPFADMTVKAQQHAPQLPEENEEQPASRPPVSSTIHVRYCDLGKVYRAVPSSQQSQLGSSGSEGKFSKALSALGIIATQSSFHDGDGYDVTLDPENAKKLIRIINPALSSGSNPYATFSQSSSSQQGVSTTADSMNFANNF